MPPRQPDINVQRARADDEKAGDDVSPILRESEEHESARYHADDDRADDAAIDAAAAAAQRDAADDHRADHPELEGGPGDRRGNMQVADEQRRDDAAEAAGDHEADRLDPPHGDAAVARSLGVAAGRVDMRAKLGPRQDEAADDDDHGQPDDQPGKSLA